MTEPAHQSRRIAMTRNITIFLLVALLPLAASAQGNCDAEAEAEQNRIIREFSSQPRSKHDQVAYLAWSKSMNTALAAAAQRHEGCRRSSRTAIRRPLSQRKRSALQGATAVRKNSKRDIEGESVVRARTNNQTRRGAALNRRAHVMHKPRKSVGIRLQRPTRQSHGRCAIKLRSGPVTSTLDSTRPLSYIYWSLPIDPISSRQ